jgi:hypothetical protein
VYSLAVHEGYLVAGGNFASAGMVPASNIARWDGAAWSALGSGVSGPGSPFVTALIVWNGDLYVGGGFTNAGGQLSPNLARWSKSVWSPPVGGSPNDWVRAFADYDGSLIVAGQFGGAGGTPARHIMRYDGSAWSGLGSGLTSDVLCLTAYGPPCWSAGALAVLGNDLFVAGTFTLAGDKPSNCIARWTGGTVGVDLPGHPVGAVTVPHLLPPSPNPSTGPTVLAFQLPRDNNVKVLVHDLRGALVRVLLSGQRPAGTHRTNWDGRDQRGVPVPSGLYFVTLVTPGASEARPVLLIH